MENSLNKSDRLGIGKSLRDTFTIARRDIIRMKRQPDLILMGAMLGIFMLVLFNYVFGGVISSGAGVDYTQFLVPGMIVLTALFGSNISGIAIAEDMNKGVIDRYRSLPMSESAIMSGRAVSDMVRNTISIIVLIGVSYAIGFRIDSIQALLAIVGLGVGLGFAFSWINAVFGLGMKSVEAVQNISMFWLFPLMFASSVFTPTEGMPGWLQSFANNSPVTVTSEAIRTIAVGTPESSTIWKSLVWIVGITVVFAIISVQVYRKRVGRS